MTMYNISLSSASKTRITSVLKDNPSEKFIFLSIIASDTHSKLIAIRSSVALQIDSSSQKQLFLIN